MAKIDWTIASVSASGATMQKIVSRMIMGGSAGLRMMIALPRSPPPIDSTPAAVVRVNSSMLARVPGPADTDDTEATISAYDTGAARETAATIGMVAWPPQVIRLTFIASRCASPLTGGATGGPAPPGARATPPLPAPPQRGGASLCPY